jgi:tetratricopeptide (TPR) repeat protein
MHAAHPIAARLDKLHDQWVCFAAERDARLLIWLATDDEARMVEAFVARESEGELAETPDLFVELRAPFCDAPTHGRALLAELMAQYEEVTRSEEPAHARWAPAAANGDDLSRLLAALVSFRAFHVGDDSTALLAIVLAPASVVSAVEYPMWLQRLVRAAPAELRFIIAEPSASEIPLAKAEPQRVRAVRCALAMPEAVEQLARGGGEQTPGDRLRALVASLASAIEAGALTKVASLFGAAKLLVGAQGWPHHGCAVSLMVAAAYAGKERHQDALESYREAEQFAIAQEALDAAVADEGEGERRKLGTKLRLQARLGAAAVLLASGAHVRAAEAYMSAIPLAGSVGDAPLQLDCERLASFCYAQADAIRQAWDVGMAGLQRGLTMDAETRKATTLLQLVEQLVSITGKHTQYRGERAPLEQRLARDLGRDWRAQLQPT